MLWRKPKPQQGFAAGRARRTRISPHVCIDAVAPGETGTKDGAAASPVCPGKKPEIDGRKGISRRAELVRLRRTRFESSFQQIRFPVRGQRQSEDNSGDPTAFLANPGGAGRVFVSRPQNA